MFAQEPISSHIWNYYTCFKVTVFEKILDGYITQMNSLRKILHWQMLFATVNPLQKYCAYNIYNSYLILKAGILNWKFQICKILKIEILCKITFQIYHFHWHLSYSKHQQFSFIKEFLLQYNPAADLGSWLHYLRVIPTDIVHNLGYEFTSRVNKKNKASQTGLLQIVRSKSTVLEMVKSA